MKFSCDLGESSYFPKHLPIVYIVFRSEDIRHIVGKPNKSFCSKLFGSDNPNFSTADCYRDSLYTVWQSLFEFRLLISACEAWQ